MSGKWIVRKPEEHQCSMPGSYSVFGEGSIWECGCGQQWKWSEGWWVRVIFRRRLKESE